MLPLAFTVMAVLAVPWSMHIVVVRGNVSPAVAISYVAFSVVYMATGTASFLLALGGIR